MLVLFAAACAGDVTPTSLAGAIPCGSTTCGSGEICFSKDSGEQCDVDLDAGIGQYQEFDFSCGTLPTDCDGVTRDCFPGQFTVVSADGRYVDQLCI